MTDAMSIEPGPEKYAPRSEGDVIDLVLGYPFAWVVSAGQGWGASPLPLRPILKDGQLVGFEGHFARTNSQIERLRRAPRALILFTGSNTYVSPSWMADRTQAPTWNYAAAAFDCDLSFIEDAAGLEDHLRDLVDAHEAGRFGGWTIDEMGGRYAGLSRGVIAFQAEILARKAVFKLGQDERGDVFEDILAGLDRSGQSSMAEMMRAYAAAGLQDV